MNRVMRLLHRQIGRLLAHSGTIERRRFVFQVDVDFSVYVGSL